MALVKDTVTASYQSQLWKIEISSTEEYFEELGLKQDYRQEVVNCEICECPDSFLLSEYSKAWSNGVLKLFRIPVVACQRCGFIFQNPRYERQFYTDFYHQPYRKLLYEKNKPNDRQIKIGRRRAKILFDNLAPYLPKKGRVIDVGCGIGLFTEPFIEAGWQAEGVDPDVGYVTYGRDELGLPVRPGYSEDLELEDNAYDVVLIIGSIQHLYDGNKIFDICQKATKKGGLIVISGNGDWPLRHSSSIYLFFNHNHLRTLTHNSMNIYLKKYGWDTLENRPWEGIGIVAVGRLGDKPSRAEFVRYIRNGHREDFNQYLQKFDEFKNKTLK